MERSRSPISHSSHSRTMPVASRSSSKRVLAIALVFSLVGLFACDSGTPEPDAPKQSGGEYGAIKQQPTEKPEGQKPVEIPRDGSIPSERFPTDIPDGLSAEIPTNFPPSIPIYPGAQAALGKGIDRGDGTGTGGVQFVSNDAPDKIYSFYEKELPANGWNIKDSKNDGVMGTLSVDKGGEQAEIFLMASPKGGTDLYIVFEGQS